MSETDSSYSAGQNAKSVSAGRFLFPALCTNLGRGGRWECSATGCSGSVFPRLHAFVSTVFSAAGVVCSLTPSQKSAKLLRPVLGQLKPLRTLTPHASFHFRFFCGGLIGGVLYFYYYYFVFRFVGYEIFCVLVRFCWIRGSYSSDRRRVPPASLVIRFYRYLPKRRVFYT
jgi:hypothetical protein